MDAEAALDELGYIVLERLLADEGIEALRAAFEAAFAGDLPASSRPGTGTRHAQGLLGRDPSFAAVAEHPRVLGLVRHVLGRPFRLFQLSGRDPRPGFGLQGLHADWMPRTGGEPWSVVTAIWLQDDFTRQNGATRVVPGSHLRPGLLPMSMRQPASRHPGEVVVTAPAGSVLVFNGHLCHGGTRNRSAGPRRVLQCQYVATDRIPPTLEDVPR